MKWEEAPPAIQSMHTAHPFHTQNQTNSTTSLSSFAAFYRILSDQLPANHTPLYAPSTTACHLHSPFLTSSFQGIFIVGKVDGFWLKIV